MERQNLGTFDRLASCRIIPEHVFDVKGALNEECVETACHREEAVFADEAISRGASEAHFSLQPYHANQRARLLRSLRSLAMTHCHDFLHTLR